MEQYQKVIIDILKASINRRNIEFNKNNNIDWNEVVNEVKQHKISSLVYSSIDRNSLKYIDNTSLSRWKQEIFKDNLIQIRHINSISKLINNLNQEGIEILLLKGLVLRNFYPRSEYRTMSDADILVKSEDYLIVRNYLIKNGFECYENNNEIHQRFINSNGLLIEVHWKLIHENYFNRNIQEFEKNVWKKSIEFNICGTNCKALCDEDLLIHMCLHMAAHTKCSGIGLRQLYDMAIFVKNKNIDWISFDRRISFYGISKFTNGLLAVVNQVFGINVPKDILDNQYVSKQEIKLLLSNILASGVYGKKEEINGFEALCKCETSEQYFYGNIERIFKLFFPTRIELSNRYKYAKNNVLLIPIAWMHHAITGIIIKRYGLIKMIKHCKKSFDILKRRKRVIKIFEL